MTEQLPERIWVPTMPTATGQKIIGGHSDEEVAGWVHFLRADTAVTKAEADAMVAAAYEVAAWSLAGNTSYLFGVHSLRAQSAIRALTPADARAALEQSVREAVEAARREWALQYLSDESQQLEAIDAAVEAERGQVILWVRQEQRFCTYHKDHDGALACARIAERLEKAAAIRKETNE